MSVKYDEVAIGRPFLIGGGLGLVAGMIIGPLVMYAFMRIENYLHGTTFLGLELLGAPFCGALVCSPIGAAVAVCWKLGSTRRAKRRENGPPAND